MLEQDVIETNELQIKLDFTEYPLVSISTQDTLIIKIEEEFFSEEPRYKLSLPQKELEKELVLPRQQQEEVYDTTSLGQLA